MSGSDVSPGQWPVRCTQGDTLPLETVGVAYEVGGVETSVTVTAAIAQVRRQASRDAALVLDLDASFSGSDVSWGDVEVPLDPGVWFWDLQVTGTAGSDAIDLTILAGTFTIRRDVSHV